MANEKEGKLTKNKKVKLNLFKPLLNKPIFMKIGLVFVVIITAILGLTLFFNLSYSRVIFPKTYVGGLNLGNKTQAQAKVVLAQSIVQAEGKKLEVLYNGRTDVIESKDFDFKYDIDKTIDTAWSVGRKGNLDKILKEQIWAIFASNRHQVSFSFSEEKLQGEINDLVNKIDKNAQDATLEVIDLEPKVVEEKTGQKVDQAKTRDLILSSFGNLLAKTQIDVVIEIIQPKIVASVASSKIEETKKLLNNKIVMTGKEKTFTLESKDIAGLLEFISNKNALTQSWDMSPGVSQEKTKKYLETIAKEVNQEAKDAKFNVVDGKVSTFQIAQTGYELDIDKATADIIKAISAQETKYELPIKTVEPTIKSAQENGIKEVVGQATTHYYGSSYNRRHNIKTGAEALHGIIVKPGEEFSTIGEISPVDASTGYLPELVIKDNATKPEYGGGLCQVSSTLFRAVMNAGLDVTARTNHSYRVPYYEPPIGMDATIYEPRPDFKFINNMDNPVLIQASVDNDASAITFTFYGTKDNRKVEMSKPVAYDITPAPDPIYTESADLAEGEIKKIDTAHAGAKADFTYKVTLNGKTLQDTNFHSEYVPWPAKYLYGPGTQIPPAE